MIQSVSSVQFSSVTQSCLTLWDSMNRSTPGLPVHHQLPEFTQTHVHWVSDAIQPSHPLLSPLLLPSIPPSIRVFSNESTLHMRWPKYWSFSLSIIPSKEIPGLISFRKDWLDLLAVQERKKESEVAQLCPTLYDPMDSSLHQAPPSIGFSRQKYWSGLPFPFPGDLPDQGNWTQVSCIAGRHFTVWATREVLNW